MDHDDPKPLPPEALREAARQRLGRGLTDISERTDADTRALVAELELHQEELRIQNEVLQQARDHLETARDRYRDLFQQAPMGYLILDDEGRIREANRAATELLAPGTDVTDQPLSAFVATESQDALHLHRRALTGAGKAHVVDELNLVGDGSSPRTVRMDTVAERNKDAAEARFRCALMDITERRRAEDQLRIAAHVFEDAGEAIVVTDPAGRIQTVNQAFTRITGYTSSDAMGVKIGRLLKSGRHSQAFYEEMWEGINQRGFWEGEIWNRRKNGDVYPEWLTINRVDDNVGQPRYFVTVFSDISQLKDSHREVEYLANHDALTGLSNRNLFQDRLLQAIAQARRDGKQAALLFLDLDDFKTINDTLGHEVGDELLVEVASRLQEVVRDVDTIARLGGDEFTVILADTHTDEAASIARRLVATLARPFEVRGRSLRVTCSIGLALYPDDGEDADTLSRAADMAMYRAKADGRNRLRLYEPALHRRLMEDCSLEDALRRALVNDELRLVYQPQFDAGDPERLVGAEALLRWEHPERGAVSPGHFIPVAEKSDLITELGRRVEKILCEQVGAWRAAGLDPPPISFNVSPRDFREGEFATALFQCMTHHGIGADQLQLEFTEGTLTERSDIVHEEIRRLHRQGIHLAIDDFGTGYSSLVNLKRLPLAELKIDKSFVGGLGTDENDEAIARASLAMARALALRTVAEGVETPQQLAWLRAHGCDRVQGFLLAHPLEAEDFRAMLQGTRRAR
ncbi:putative bifunctional diguanylate cyclase/phosphodiesterase [Thioalkalivibrio halophilus]|uniref:GGDEF domain-containing protein n=1 Tax=Thioalkalivibrio halophilus TaxID=252474 RepID=A0A1V2ZWU4_9GAMM|nr:EAL domain-containing protein [Thioalkalivibrio halophilus]OOC09580.1 GGDEF domain-containing protein [Thioalkalivibrio halophilus]